MKKLLTFGCPLAAAVALGAYLRRWQRLSAFEEYGLLAPGAPASWCLVGLILLSAVGFLLLARWVWKGAGSRGYLAAFALPWRGMMAVYLLAGGLLVAAGLLGIRDAQMGLVEHLSGRVFAVALVPTGLDLALVGWLGAQRQEGQGRFAWPLLLPGWCGCAWLISAYQIQAAQPNTMAYAPYLLGALCAVGSCYYMASFSFERPRPVACAWLGAMALILLSTAAVDAVMTRDVCQALVCLGYMIYLAAQLKCLLYRSQVSAELEAWEAPAEDEKTEVSEDE